MDPTRNKLERALRKLPKFKRNIENETVEIGGVPVKFWRWKRRWYWGVADKEDVRLQKPPP